MSENLNNKTCGECKHFFLHSEGHCKSNDGLENAHNDACTFFEPKVITNGDKIRQMSNEELVKLLGCARRLANCIHLEDDYPCEQCGLEYLNAPAESEVEDEQL